MDSYYKFPLMRIRVPSTLHCHLHRIDYLTYFFNMRGAIQSTNMMNYPTLIVGNNTVCYEAGFFRHHRCETMDHQTARDKLSLRSPRQLRQLRSPAPQTATAPQILLTRDDPRTLDSAQPHVPQSRSPDTLAQFAAHSPVRAAESDHGNAK